MEKISDERLDEYFDLCERHDKEKLEFFSEYAGLIKQVQQLVFVDQEYEEGEKLLNLIPEKLLHTWEPAMKLYTTITYKKIIKEEI